MVRRFSGVRRVAVAAMVAVAGLAAVAPAQDGGGGRGGGGFGGQMMGAGVNSHEKKDGKDERPISASVHSWAKFGIALIRTARHGRARRGAPGSAVAFQAHQHLTQSLVVLQDHLGAARDAGKRVLGQPGVNVRFVGDALDQTLQQRADPFHWPATCPMRRRERYDASRN